MENIYIFLWGRFGGKKLLQVLARYLAVVCVADAVWTNGQAEEYCWSFENL